jgi:PAS domain S-box-containing protein
MIVPSVPFADSPPPASEDPYATSAALALALEELEAAEEELRQQNEELVDRQVSIERQRQRYEYLFEFAPDPYLVTDRLGTIREANQAAGALFGVDRRFLVGKPLVTFVEPGERHLFRTHIERLTPVRPRQEWDTSIRPRTGDHVIVSVVAHIAEQGPGRQEQLRWVLRDVTEHRNLEHALRTQRAQLERRVAERTEQLTQMLQQKEELLVRERAAHATLEASNRLTTDFLAVLSHEFRTPLQAICGYAEILSAGIHGPLTEQQEADLSRIRRSQEHLLGLVTTILDFSKLKSGQGAPLELQPVPVDEMLRNIFPMVEPQMQAKRLSFIYDHCEDTSIIAWGEREKLQQIVINLLSNAVKFTEPGGHLSVSCESDGRFVSIRVADTGAGIPEAQLDLIFEPFVQVSQRRESSGTGLGLAISRSLAEAMGGSLTATSQVGVGSTFTLKLAGYTLAAISALIGNPVTVERATQP